MTIATLAPIIGARYRHATTARIATLTRYDRDVAKWPAQRSGRNRAVLQSDGGYVWTGSTEDFWEDWSHES